MKKEEPDPVFERIYRKIASKGGTNVYGTLIKDRESSAPVYSTEVTLKKEFTDFCRIKSLNKMISGRNSREKTKHLHPMEKSE